MKLKTGEYWGSYSTERVINGLVITKSFHLQYNKIASHYHANPYYSFVLEGKYFEHYGNETISLKKGDVVFHPSHAEHSNVFENLATTCLNVEFSNEWLHRFEIDPAKLEGQPLINNVHQKALVYKLNKEMEDDDQFSDMSILGIAAELTRSIVKNKSQSSTPKYLLKVKSYIDQEPCFSPTLQELSQLVKISPEHLCREFKNKFGLTLGEYIRHKKISKACDLLKKKGMPIEDIAFELGFSDSSHLNKTFKKIIGLSPGAYRSTL